jgi:hypothetical protein
VPDGAGLSNYQNWLYEMQGEAQKLFPAEFVLLAMLSGVIREDGGFIKYDQSYERFTRAMDGNREVFDGASVRFPLMLAGLQAGGNPSETGTWNAPGPIDTSKANVNLGRVLQPLAISLDLERDSKGGSTSAMSAVENYISEAYKAAARIENDELHGGTNAIGTGTDSSLLASVTSAPGSPGLVDPGRHRRELRPAHPGPRRRRPDPLERREPRQRAAPQDRVGVAVGGTVTFDTNAVRLGRLVGQHHVLRERGRVHPGVVRQRAAVARAGRRDDRHVRGRRQGDGAAVAGRRRDAGDAQALSDAVLDNAVYLLRGNGVGASDFGIAHPKVVDLYKQSKARRRGSTRRRSSSRPGSPASSTRAPTGRSRSSRTWRRRAASAG